MGADDRFSQWASLFVAALNESADNNRLETTTQPAYTGVTQSASELLQSIDAGGVPVFITANLIEIAKQNGIDVRAHWTPNQIIDMIRAKAVRCADSVESSSEVT